MPQAIAMEFLAIENCSVWMDPDTGIAGIFCHNCLFCLSVFVYTDPRMHQGRVIRSLSGEACMMCNSVPLASGPPGQAGACRSFKLCIWLPDRLLGTGWDTISHQNGWIIATSPVLAATMICCTINILGKPSHYVFCNTYQKKLEASFPP